jgi:hypothetical protein
MFGHLSPLFGLKVELRKPEGAEQYGNAGGKFTSVIIKTIHCFDDASIGSKD